MTDERKPWQEWPEYRGMLDLVAVTGATKHAEVDALCARVWREAYSARAGHVLNATETTVRALETAQARADAAEARAARLTGALWLGIAHATGELTAITMAEWALVARAALRNEPPALSAYQRTEILAAAASKPGLEDALRRGDVLWEEARAALADVPDAGRVQAFRAYAEREAQAIAADPDVDRMARQARLRREAYTAMRRTLERTRCHCHPRGDGSGWPCERCVALALARQAEEG